MDRADSPWGALFTAVAPGRSSDHIAEQISQAVYSGQLSVGDKLPNERELGQLFGVSRSTLREAIRILEAEGMVAVQRGTTGGTFVSAPEASKAGFGLAALIRFHEATPEDFAEIRYSFESESAGLAARRATDQQIAELGEIVEAAAAVARDSESDWAQFVDWDLAFHQKLAEATGNSIRVAIMLAVHHAFRQTSLALSRHDAEWRQEQAEQLRAICDAVRNRQAPLARKLMRAHVLANLSVSAPGISR